MAKIDGGYTEEFERFWQEYPKNRRTGKGGAFKNWKKLKNTAQPQELLSWILTALKWQTASDAWKQDNGKWIPLPETYLSKRRWEDEPPEQTATKERYQDINGVWHDGQ
jgi:hypothetical protein